MNEENFVGRIRKRAKGISKTSNRAISERGSNGGIIMWKVCGLQPYDLNVAE